LIAVITGSGFTATTGVLAVLWVSLGVSAASA
jgi:hypothetical protein